MAVLPEGVGLDVTLHHVEKPTRTFLIDWSSKQVAGMDEGLPAMRQAVEIILQNERFRWQIYSSDFGSELENLVGEERDYIESELPRRIEDAFSGDSRILTVENFVFTEKIPGELSCSFEGVESAFAVQAGREVRIMVKPDAVNDDQLILLARAITKKIEEELDYPGQIKVNVIRESRAVEYAK